jgi:hypothetical protein
MGRQGRRREQLLDDLKVRTGSWKFKQQALACALWRTRFGRGYGPVVRETMGLVNGQAAVQLLFKINLNVSGLLSLTLTV